MDEQGQKAVRVLIERLYQEVFQQGNLALIETFFRANFMDHSTPDQVVGPKGVVRYVNMVRMGFPDLAVSIEDLIVEGNKAVVRTSWSGTHLGFYEGVAPTGKHAYRTLIQIFTVSDGKIVEEWNEGSGLLASLYLD